MESVVYGLFQYRNFPLSVSDISLGESGLEFLVSRSGMLEAELAQSTSPAYSYNFLADINIKHLTRRGTSR